jgi:diguanylate cyclase (GGDEF)-like protein
VGDRVLKELAALLREQTRKSDVLGRYGGEEFLVVLAVKWPSESIWVAERIRLAVEKLLYVKSGSSEEPLSVTVSIGVARSLPSEAGAPDCQEIIKQADQALYEAKALGRNQVCRWDTETGSAVPVERVEKVSG